MVLEDVTDSIEILHVAGSRAAELMAEVCPESEEVPFLQMRELSVLGVDALVFRISFTGEAGYELHVDADDAVTLWQRIWAHPASAAMGLQPFGGQAVNSLRIEKAFRVKGDLDYALGGEAGIDAFCRKKAEADVKAQGNKVPSRGARAGACAEGTAPRLPAAAWRG